MTIYRYSKNRMFLTRSVNRMFAIASSICRLWQWRKSRQYLSLNRLKKWKRINSMRRTWFSLTQLIRCECSRIEKRFRCLISSWLCECSFDWFRITRDSLRISWNQASCKRHSEQLSWFLRFSCIKSRRYLASLLFILFFLSSSISFSLLRSAYISSRYSQKRITWGNQKASWIAWLLVR